MTDTLQSLVSEGALGLSDGYRTRKDQLAATGLPILRVADVLEGRLAPSFKDHIAEEFRSKMGAKISQPGDVLITTKGTVGRVARVPEGFPEHSYSPQVCFLRPLDESRIDGTWLYQWARSPEFLDQIGLAKDQTDMAPYVSLTDMRKVRVTLPNIIEQKRIAAVLGAFDDLIETNQALIDVVADAAKCEGQRMVAEFSDRDTVPLTDYATITKGFSYKSAELVPGSDTLVNLKNIGRGGVFQERGFKPLTSTRFKQAQIVFPGEVVVAMTDLTQQREVVARPVRIPDVQVEGRMVASLDLAVVRPHAGHAPAFLVGLLATDDFHAFARDYSNGTTVLHMSAKAFEDYRVPRIDPSEAEPYSERIGMLNRTCDSLASEIADLTLTRDELLPLLMSGRIRVAEAEEALASLTPEDREVS